MSSASVASSGNRICIRWPLRSWMSWMGEGASTGSLATEERYCQTGSM
ncbi:MAG: hypothetical protein PUF04_06135 [bacterium]|nr:hypothetical protein [bacterium]